MKIATFIAHPMYSIGLSKTGYDFYAFSLTGKSRWDNSYGVKPDNIILTDNTIDDSYNLAIANNIDEATFFKKNLSCPVVLVGHGAIPNIYNDCADIIVGLCEEHLIYADNKIKHIIPLCVSKHDYYGYTGDIPLGICVANAVKVRPELDYDRTLMATRGCNIVTVGSMNEEIANGIGSVSHNCISKMMKHFRIMVYTPKDFCGMSYAVCEALMTGMPVALSNFAGWSRYIDNGINGFVSDDMDELNKFVIDIINSREYAIDVGSKARQMMIDNFNITVFVDRWNKLIAKYGGQ